MFPSLHRLLLLLSLFFYTSFQLTYYLTNFSDTFFVSDTKILPYLVFYEKSFPDL